MTAVRDSIEIQQFANKNVVSLPQEASIGEVIRLMYRQGIRHIPIVHEMKVVGIVNPLDVLTFIGNETFEIDFDQDLTSIMSGNFVEVSPEASLFEVVGIISKNPEKAVIITEGARIEGIYTESDILNTEFLWTNISDRALQSDTDLGQEISEFKCTTTDTPIRQSIRLMVELEQDYIGIISGDSKDLRGVLSFFEIAHHLYFMSYRRGKNLLDILDEPIHTIFPSSGVYYIEPILLSQMRSDLWVNESFFSVVLNSQWEPRRIVTIHDIVGYLIDNSDFFA
ncbi:MAG: CBS domain-containing protein [Candidatus Kariarchaeaceae archaeon]